MRASPRSLFAPTLVACLLSLAPAAAHAVGPGIGNLDCGEGDYFRPFGWIENPSGPNGTNVAVMARGYFMTIFAPDSGRPPGEIGIYDVSDPRAPVEVDHVEGGDAEAFREAHSLPVAWIDGRFYMAIQTIEGIQIWDFTEPLEASRVGSIDLPGVNGGDYENVAWQTTWQGRYLYVAGGNQGIYVVDTVDPRSPQLLAQVPTSQTGGFRVGPLFALGDLLVISNMDQNGAYAILDITIPDEPALLSRVGNAPRMYAIAVGGNDRFYTAGRDGDFLIHSFEDPTDIREVINAPIGQDQLYAAAQDHFVFLGRQNNVVKVDVTDETNPTVVGEGTLDVGHPDHGQVTPLGNLIYIGNDHGTGSAFFCHQRGPDTTPPAVQATYPRDGSIGVSEGARVGIVFGDYVDTETVFGGGVQVRPVNGSAIEGIFSYGFNTLSFSPAAPFEPDTTYEVVIGEGVADVMGNPLGEEVVFRFSTGASIVTPPPGECTASAEDAYQATPGAIPGVIEGEDFDPSGYSDDSSGNEGGAYRTDVDVDIKPVGDGHFVGWMAAGEWLEYTVDVSVAGIYEVSFTSGSVEAGQTLQLDGCGETLATIEVPQVSAWDETGTSKVTVSLDAGLEVLRVTAGGDALLDFDAMEFELIRANSDGGETDDGGGDGGTTGGTTADGSTSGAGQPGGSGAGETSDGLMDDSGPADPTAPVDPTAAASGDGSSSSGCSVGRVGAEGPLGLLVLALLGLRRRTRRS